MEEEKFHPQMPQSTVYALRHLMDAGLNVQVGKYSYGSPRISWARADITRKLEIGAFCSFADGVRIYVGIQGRHTTDLLTTYPIGMVFGSKGIGQRSAAFSGGLDVKIGSDVWVGLESLIFPGVSIGHGACVGSRSVVTKDIPPYAIVAGAPARLIRYRFDENTIARLLELCWWDWPDEKIRQNIDLFNDPDVTGVVSRIGSDG